MRFGAVMRTLVAVSLVMIAALGGLWWHARTHANAADYVYTSAEEATAEGAVGDEEVVMRVNGEPITRTEFELAVQSLPEAARGAMASGAARKVIAEELIRMQLLARLAEERGLTEREEIRQQLRLARVQGDLMRKNLLAQVAVQDMIDNAETGTPQQLYAELRDEFETIEARHIVVGWEGSRLGAEGVTRTKAEARERAEQAAAALRAGEPFETVHGRFGDNPNIELGPVRRDSLPEEMEEAIFALQAGELSSPVETAWGYHIFEAESRSVPSFEELEPRLTAQARELWTRVALEKMRETAAVDFDESFFADR